MAITNNDGSIVLTTKVDTSGIKKGFEKAEKSSNDFGGTAKAAFAAARSSAALLALEIGKTLLSALVSVTKQVAEFSRESADSASKAEASVYRLVDIYGKASKAVGDFIDQNAMALGMSKTAAASFASVYGNLFSVWADQATNAELTNRYLQMTAVVASKTGRTVEDVQERVRSGLLGNTEAIEDLGIFVNVKTIEMTDAFKRMASGRSWEQLDAYTQQQIRTMAILEQATQKYGDQVAETSVLARSKFSAAYEDFKNTWGEAVNIILLPLLNVVTNIILVATTGLKSLFGFSTSILKTTQKITGAISKNVDSQKDLTKEMSKTVKAQKEMLAPFDTVNILSSGISKEDGIIADLGLDKMSSSTNDAIDTLEKFYKRCEYILSPLKESFGGLFVTIEETFDQFYKNVLSPVAEWFEVELAPQTIQKITDEIVELDVAIDELAKSLSGVFGQNLTHSIELVLETIVELGTEILKTFTGISQGISENIDGVSTLITLILDILLPVITFVAEVVLGLLEGVAKIILNIISLVVYLVSFVINIIGTIVGLVIGIFTGNWEMFEAFITNAATSLFNAIMAIAKTLAAAIDAILGIIASAVELVINEVAGILRFVSNAAGLGWEINNVDINLPNFEESYFTDYFDLVPIPPIATGSVAPYNAESGSESTVGRSNQGYTSDNETAKQYTEVVLELDSREFGRAVIEMGGQENKRIGTRLVSGRA